MPTPEILTRSAPLAPSTFRREGGVAYVDATITTGAEVRRSFGFERLAVNPQAVTAPDSVPLRDNHQTRSIRDILGRVSDFRFEEGAMIARLEIRDTAAADLVERGDVAAVSIGYLPTAFSDSREGGHLVRTQTAWELREVSLTDNPADTSATIRSATVPNSTTTEAASSAAIAAIQEALDPKNITADMIRSELSEKLTPRQRKDLEGVSDEDLMRVFGPKADKPQTPPTVIRAHVAPTGSEDPAADFNLRLEGLVARMTGAEPSAGARQYAGLGFAEHAALSLRSAGETGLGVMSRETVLHRALNGAHGTDDFPNLLTGAGSRVLRGAYTEAASPLKALAQHVTASDFRRNDILAIGGFGLLSEVTEHGEITATSTAEAKESWQLKTFGKTFALTRKALVNDDLGAFGRVTAELGRAAAETENTALAALLVSNPVMGDGKPLFHVDHKNLSTLNSVPAVESFSAARLAMRQQVGVTGERISVTPRVLLVGPAMETTAEQFLAEIYPGEVEQVNPFAGKLKLAVEPRLSGGAWYVFAAPTEAPVLLLGHLASAPGPQISSRDGWETLGREFRVVLDFGVAATDWRGVYRSPGTNL